MIKKIRLSADIFRDNDREAGKNRRLFKKAGVFVVNLMGSPGCGKTTLIENLAKNYKGKIRLAVIEGDIATGKDAQRIAKAGVPVSLLNTDQVGNACHLSSKMIRKAYEKIRNTKPEIIIIENIGNLICPADFDLGENLRVSMVSITEGDDKVSKYPPMFVNAEAVILSKIDIIKHFKYNLKFVRKEIKRLNPNAEIFEISLKNKHSLKFFSDFLINKRTTTNTIYRLT